MNPSWYRARAACASGLEQAENCSAENASSGAENDQDCIYVQFRSVLAVPPAAAERLEQGDGVGVARGAGLDEALERLLVAGSAVSSDGRGHLAQLELGAGDVEALAGGLLGVERGLQRVGVVAQGLQRVGDILEGA